MKLYSFPGRCSTAIHISIRRCGIKMDVEVLNPDAKPDEFMELHPAGTVPLLDDDGHLLTQTIAILFHVDAMQPSSGLLGLRSDRLQRAEAMRWLCFAEADLHPAFGPLFKPESYSTDLAHHLELRRAAVARIKRLFAMVDARLIGRSWVAGPRSCADDVLYVIGTWARLFRIDLSGLLNLQAFMQRMDGDPAVLHVLQREGLLAYENAPT